MAPRRRRDSDLSRASAYYRLAAKAELAGAFKQGATYRRIADRLVAKARRNREARRNLKGN